MKVAPCSGMALVSIITVFFVTVCLPLQMAAQQFGLEEQKQAANSENGWYLSPHGVIKVFVVFVEIDYDENPEDNPHPIGTDGWKPGQLPSYADDMFDTEVIAEPKGAVSRYYHICSFGKFRVLGDYWFETITLKESEVGRLSLPAIKRSVSEHLANFDEMLAANGSSLSEFDRWRSDTGLGKPRINKGDDPTSLDHVMMIVRNFHGLPGGNGQASGGSFPTVGGYKSDTYSQFNGHSALPETVLFHEFNHLLLGANNFHCCGGGAMGFTNFFIPVTYGWGMMGLANMSLRMCNAWDRHRLGWKQEGKQFLISALDTKGTTERIGDLDPLNPEHSGKYLLRDFATTGDALRIKLPFIDSTKFQQWLWIENHQGGDRNGVEFDRYIYEHREKYTKLKPGLFMMIQVDKNQKTGNGIYGGYANYLRPVLADGHYDIQWTADSLWVKEKKSFMQIHTKPKDFANPLTGSQDMEAISYNKEPKDSTLESSDIVDPRIEKDDNGELIYKPKFGHSRHAFRLDGNHKIGMGTNPSTANVLTYVTGGAIPRNPNPKNNRVSHLNGVSVSILEEHPDGSILVDVQFEDTRIDTDTRWCSEKVVLHDIPGAEFDLEVMPKTTVRIDHGETATRRKDPTIRNGKVVFTSPTTFVMSENTNTKLHRKAKIVVENCSQMVIASDAKVQLEPWSRIIVKAGSELLVEPGAVIKGRKRIKARGGTITFAD